jgi:hypothetical protein
MMQIMTRVDDEVYKQIRYKADVNGTTIGHEAMIALHRACEFGWLAVNDDNNYNHTGNSQWRLLNEAIDMNLVKSYDGSLISSYDALDIIAKHPCRKLMVY